MAGARATVTVVDAGLGDLFARLARLGVDFSPAMSDIAGELEETTRRRFEDGAGPGGVAWVPSRRARKAGGKTLIDSGQLLASITSTHGPTSAEAGTNKVYGALHQFGGTLQRTVTTYRRIKPRMTRISDWRFVPRHRANFAQDHSVTVTYPARPFLGLDADGEARIVAIVGGWLARLGRGAAA